MTRVTLHLDETVPLQPKAVLTINGQEVTLSEKEFTGLYSEMWWAVDHIKHAKRMYYCNLAHKYKEVQHA